MKRLTLLILTALVLSACTPKAYTESFDAGKAALQKGDFDQAINKFENAIEEKETTEAKDYLHFAKSLQESRTLYHDGDFDAAIYSIKKLLKETSTEKLEGKVTIQANELLKDIQQAKTVSEKMKEKMIKGKTLLEDNQFDQAAAAFKEVAETTDLPDVTAIETMAKDASKLLEETTKKKNSAEQKKQKQTEENTKNKEEEKQKQEEANKPITQEQAVDLVRQHLNISSEQNVKVVYDHDAANGDYVIHVYEFVVDNPSTGEGHTATWGWYGVNKQTKAVYDAMQ
ncbi:tetratricopeptide repeat protein [Neobacillus sp. NPDC097160]|uniref:tetratricopeptide repeat protein n=1 Tax=Neobacillus sp. NPDC097160 TaxID=3364298 RepID=UPI00380BFBE3